MFFQFRLPHKESNTKRGKEAMLFIALLVIMKCLLTVLNITIGNICGQIKSSKRYLCIYFY